MWFYSKNNEQQGPVAADEIGELLRNGELSNSTLVWKEGMAQWTPLGEVPELREVAPVGEVSSSDNPSESGQPSPYQPPQSGSPQASGQPQLTAPMPQNTLALTSMILGICGFITCGVTGIVAVILGHIARKQIRNSAVPQAGDGMALAGLITGYIGSVIFLAYIAFVILGVVAGIADASSP
jgi:peptidyl-prolyl cis-trans isomerase B (cyclophilin B)